MLPPNTKTFEAFAKLRKEHPKDSHEQLLERWGNLVMSDESLKKAVCDDAFHMAWEELCWKS